MSGIRVCMPFFKIKNIHPERSEKKVSETRRKLYAVYKKYN